jgi:hypothetical protein
MKANEQIEPAAQPVAPAVTSNTQTAQPARVEIPAEIAQLTGLVKEIGGVDALKTLLVNAAKVSVNAQAAEDQERTALIATLKANHASGDFTDDELKAMPIGTLRKFAGALQPAFVDYSAVAPRTVANSAEQVTPRPSLLIKQ